MESLEVHGLLSIIGTVAFTGRVDLVPFHLSIFISQIFRTITEMGFVKFYTWFILLPSHDVELMEVTMSVNYNEEMVDNTGNNDILDLWHAFKTVDISVEKWHEN